MHYSPLEMQENLQIGQVDFVSPDEIKIALDIETPENVSLSTGTPRAFPRINSYVLIRTEEGSVVAQVEWITVERSNYPKRKGLSDFGLIDLPYPLRKMSVNPLGVLKQPENDEFVFHRGVNVFPSVGDVVYLPTEKQLRAIIESGGKKNVQIGTSPFAESAKVYVDPDKLFGRHLAILGNTGSGKSCSVAGLVRWSLEEAKKKSEKEPNARFIILDPNGEYKKTFKDLTNVKYYSVNAENAEQKLNVPLWFWNSKEWGSFAQASGKTQRPILRRALKEIKTASIHNDSTDLNGEKSTFRRFLSYQLVRIKNDIVTNYIKEEPKKFGNYLESILVDLDSYANRIRDCSEDIENISSAVESCKQTTYSPFQSSGKTVHNYTPFAECSVEPVVDAIDLLLHKLGGLICEQGPSEDCPLPYKGSALADHIQQLSIQEKVSQYLDFLVLRIRSLIADEKTKQIVEGTELTLTDWLNTYIGSDSSNGSITVIDMSLVPAELIHILTSVIARMTFEALQRYRKLSPDGKCLPTVLVMEEAHTFIKKYTDESENQSAADICCQVFEKIAREGRKFGLGLVLSSQRPSELSPTVLSQCNTFLLHRISNDKDQELVLKLVPDNQRGLLRDLPSLPSQNAILLGWASELPMLVKMRTLPGKQRPQSEDPDFWDVWTGKKERPIDWDCVATDWQSNC